MNENFTPPSCEKMMTVRETLEEKKKSLIDSLSNVNTALDILNRVPEAEIFYEAVVKARW